MLCQERIVLSMTSQGSGSHASCGVQGRAGRVDVELSPDDVADVPSHCFGMQMGRPGTYWRARLSTSLWVCVGVRNQ